MEEPTTARIEERGIALSPIVIAATEGTTFSPSCADVTVTVFRYRVRTAEDTASAAAFFDFLDTGASFLACFDFFTAFSGLALAAAFLPLPFTSFSAFLPLPFFTSFS